jgi:hypothetical protein
MTCGFEVEQARFAIGAADYSQKKDEALRDTKEVMLREQTEFR